AEGGVEEFFYDRSGNLNSGRWNASYRVFQTLSNTLVLTKLLICPADRSHIPADTFGKLTSTNVSYWLLVTRESPLTHPNLILTGDGFWDDLWKMFRCWGYSDYHLPAYHGVTRGNVLF